MELVGVNLDFYPVPLFSDCGSSLAAYITTPGHLARNASAGFDKVDFYAVFSQEYNLSRAPSLSFLKTKLFVKSILKPPNF